MFFKFHPMANLLVLEASFVHRRLALKVRSPHKILECGMMVIHDERILKQISLGHMLVRIVCNKRNMPQT